jgi:PadR family transcriptional regulator, regulatory protein AphA
MSIRGAILGLLTERPMTGYEIAKRFDHALGRVWPARPNQVYTEINRMEEKGLVEVVEIGARNARRYAATEAGLEALTSWLLDRSPPEQQLRFDGLLKANFAFALPTDQRRMFLEAERRFWIDQVSWIESQMKHLPDDDTETTKARRLAAEAGRDLYRVMLAWSERYLAEADRPA